MTPKPRIICFDLGGVVVRICRSWAEACSRARLPERDPERFTEPRLVAARHELVDRYQCGRLGCDQFFSGLAGATGGLYTPEEVKRVHDHWIIEEYPGVAELIHALNRSGSATTACLSNTNHAHWIGMLGHPGAPGMPSPAVQALQIHGVSHKMGASKPGEAIYRQAQELFAAAPADILFFDDLTENVSSARALGWRAELIDHTGDTAAQVRAHLSAHGIQLSTQPC